MIELKNIGKQFGGRVVLKDVNLSIQEGEVVFIVGRSGTGKSVLLRHILGLNRPDLGEVWIDGIRMDSLAESEMASVRRLLAMVFQNPALLDSLTVKENLTLGLRARGQAADESRVREALRSVGIENPEQLLSKFPSELSFGMQKRLSIARAAILSPKYLLLDEPTTGLDPRAAAAIHSLIFGIQKTSRIALVFVSHDLRAALHHATRIVCLDQGSVVEDCSPSDFRKSSVPIVQSLLRGVA